MQANGLKRSGAARYRAGPTWIGPILGEVVGPAGDRRVRIGGAADPLLGKAALAALIPARAQGRRFVPSNARGEPLGWAAALKSDRKGRFELRVPIDLWDTPAEGVLVYLLYDYSSDAGKAAAPSDAVVQISKWGEPARQAIEREVREVLSAPVDKLRGALVEVDMQEAHRKPDEPPTELTFALASCQYPAGFLDRDVAEESYRRLLGWFELSAGAARPKPTCLVLLGDQIYADATAGLFDPTAKHDRFDLPYERLLRIPVLRQILRRAPSYTMLDDHEIEDNWEPGILDHEPDANLIDGRLAYFYYQRMAGPDQPAPVGDSKDPVWYTFAQAGFSFFVADTRTERRARAAETIEQARIMSDGQFATLLQWLDRQPPDVPKFIASPACLLPRHRRAAQSYPGRASSLRSDAWDGFPSSFEGLLAHIAGKGIRNVIFLSGDEHISFVTTADITDKRTGNVTRIYSIHSSALYSPFPFANSVQESLYCDEAFDFGDFHCKVAMHDVVPGDGFALLKVWREGKQWRLGWLFDRAAAALAPNQIDLV